MENAVDALKMAGAAMLFVLAFTIAMFMFSKARTTTDAVLDNLKLEDYFSRVEPLKGNETRKVGIESIIPTLYRYCQGDDNIMIRIIDDDGSDLQIFDRNIEAIAQSNFKATNPDDQPYYDRLKKLYGDSDRDAYLCGAPWNNGELNPYYIERINSYIYGIKSEHMPSLSKIYNKEHNLIKYQNREFIESYLEYRTSGQVQTDKYGEEITIVPASTKIIITYTLIKE